MHEHVDMNATNDRTTSLSFLAPTHFHPQSPLSYLQHHIRHVHHLLELLVVCAPRVLIDSSHRSAGITVVGSVLTLKILATFFRLFLRG